MTAESQSKRVLVCGHRSFAARGLAEALRAEGHEVVCFSRGEVARDGAVVTGPVFEMADNPHLAGPFDAVVNYVLLKNDPIEPNLRYIDALVRFCAEAQVKHLVHVSSMSVYRASVRRVTEDAQVEPRPERKGSYGSLKTATELHLASHVSGSTKLSLVRPGFILGQGLVDPIVGTGIRLPWNRLLALGNARSQFPLISRDMVNASIVRVVSQPPAGAVERLILVDPGSPTKGEYLRACCTGLGCGEGVWRLPVWLWLLVAGAGAVVLHVVGLGRLSRFKAIAAVCRRQRFDPAATVQRLGLSLSFDWRVGLAEAVDGQQMNVSLPYQPFALGRTAGQRVNFVGYGRIVKQKHLPALERLGFCGDVAAYDLRAGTDEDGRPIHAIDGARLPDADLHVVASPGPVHTEAIPLLETADGPVLVEKPLCYQEDELRAWQQFAQRRGGNVLVCHNYRFKANVARMMDHLARCNPGKLCHVFVHFQSPPVRNDWAAWRTRERRARTLLMDYSLHFLDVACMFTQQAWRIVDVSHEINVAGETALIRGEIASDAYRVSFLLRQGFMPRVARLRFCFQNYAASLGFFPDTFVAHMGHDSPVLHFQEGVASARATLTKVVEKVTGRDRDASHALVYDAAMGGHPAAAGCLRVDAVAAFYRLAFRLGEAVYGADGSLERRF